MEKLKKVFTCISLTGIAVVAVLLILAVFGVKVFEGALLKVLLVTATLAVASGLSINELSVIKRKRILGIIGLSLLGVSTIFAILLFTTSLFDTVPVLGRIAGVTAISSVVFILIISQYSKMDKSAMALQIPTYIGLALIGLTLCLLVCDINMFQYSAFVTFFSILCIVTVSLYIALNVLAVRKRNAEAQTEKIVAKETSEEYDELQKENMNTKQEYLNLKEENLLLKQEIQQLKAELENLKKDSSNQ